MDQFWEWGGQVDAKLKLRMETHVGVAMMVVARQSDTMVSVNISWKQTELVGLSSHRVHQEGGLVQGWESVC